MAPASSPGRRAWHPCLLPPRPRPPSRSRWLRGVRSSTHPGILGRSFWPSRLGAAPPRPGPISHLAPGLVCCWAAGRPPTRPWGGDGCGAVPSWTWVQILVATSRLCAGPHPCPGPCFLRCERGFLAATSWGLAEDRAVRGDPKLSAQHLEVITCSVDVACPSTPSPWAARPFEAWGSASPCRCPSPSTCLGA